MRLFDGFPHRAAAPDFDDASASARLLGHALACLLDASGRGRLYGLLTDYTG